MSIFTKHLCAAAFAVHAVELMPVFGPGSGREGNIDCIFRPGVNAGWDHWSCHSYRAKPQYFSGKADGNIAGFDSGWYHEVNETLIMGDLTLLASHDSGCSYDEYNDRSRHPFGWQDEPRGGGWVGGIRNYVAQQYTISEQLRGGVRMFDLRFRKNGGPQKLGGHEASVFYGSTMNRYNASNPSVDSFYIYHGDGGIMHPSMFFPTNLPEAVGDFVEWCQRDDGHQDVAFFTLKIDQTSELIYSTKEDAVLALDHVTRRLKEADCLAEKVADKTIWEMKLAHDVFKNNAKAKKRVFLVYTVGGKGELYNEDTHTMDTTAKSGQQNIQRERDTITASTDSNFIFSKYDNWVGGYSKEPTVNVMLPDQQDKFFNFWKNHAGSWEDPTTAKKMKHVDLQFTFNGWHVSTSLQNVEQNTRNGAMLLEDGETEITDDDGRPVWWHTFLDRIIDVKGTFKHASVNAVQIDFAGDWGYDEHSGTTDGYNKTKLNRCLWCDKHMSLPQLIRNKNVERFMRKGMNKPTSGPKPGGNNPSGPNPCTKETGGTCRWFGCDGSRNAICDTDHGYKCICDSQKCAIRGQCVKPNYYVAGRWFEEERDVGTLLIENSL